MLLNTIGIYNTKIISTAIDDSIVKYVNIDAPPKKSFNILFLSRVEKYKGIYILLDSFQLLQQKYRNISLIIAGNGSELKIIEEKLKNNKDVFIAGYVNGQTKNDIFNLADVFVLPSENEGMPMSIIEAMFFGLPIVTREVGELKDFFINGKMGFITSSQDPKIFASFIEILMQDKILDKSINPIFEEERIVDVKHSLAEIEKAKKMLGFAMECALDTEINLSINNGLYSWERYFRSIYKYL